MAVHALTVKKIISMIRQVFPDAPETYVMALINEALVEAGKYKTKIEYAKADAVEDQMWYTLKEPVGATTYSNIEVNKVMRVDLKDSSGDYIRIPRLLDNEVLKMDIT
jgi:hypothetical protein